MKKKLVRVGSGEKQEQRGGLRKPSGSRLEGDGSRRSGDQ